MIKWIIQRNLIKPTTLAAFKQTFNTFSIPFEEVMVIPFSNELPKFEPAELNLFYGSTTLMINAANHPVYKAGVFYDAKKFTTANYLNQWQENMLNSDGKVMPFRTFVKGELLQKEEWFIRPNEDHKSFAGTLMTTNDISEWYKKIKTIDNPDLNTETLIFVASPRKIYREWRNFIVNGRVIDSSRYVLNGELNPSGKDIPPEMITFSEKCASHYSPHKIFVMDIAETHSGFKIIECNCFNGTGFYDHDIPKIIQSITDAIKKTELL